MKNTNKPADLKKEDVKENVNENLTDTNFENKPADLKKEDVKFTGFIKFHTPCYIDFINYSKGQILDVTKEQQDKFMEFANVWQPEEKE